MKKSVIFLFLVFAVSLISLVNGEECYPDYRCGSWGLCEEGFQSRVCFDVRCGQENITERRECDLRCVPDISCGTWGPCNFVNKISDFSSGNLTFIGYEERLCSDKNDCVEPYLEERVCKSSSRVSFTYQTYCGRKFVVGMDEATKVPVSKISIDSWRDNFFDLSFVQNNQFYCPSCYDGAKNFGEFAIDCGGNCRPCLLENPSSEGTKNFFIYFAVFSFVLIVLITVIDGFLIRNKKIQ